MSEHENREAYRCPGCGRYVSPEDGYFVEEDPDDDMSYVIPVCDETCADKVQNMQREALQEAS